jgi:multidrug efflux pump subunit AcrB
LVGVVFLFLEIGGLQYVAVPVSLVGTFIFMQFFDIS